MFCFQEYIKNYIWISYTFLTIYVTITILIFGYFIFRIYKHGSRPRYKSEHQAFQVFFQILHLPTVSIMGWVMNPVLLLFSSIFLLLLGIANILFTITDFNPNIYQKRKDIARENLSGVYRIFLGWILLVVQLFPKRFEEFQFLITMVVVNVYSYKKKKRKAYLKPGYHILENGLTLTHVWLLASLGLRYVMILII